MFFSFRTIQTTKTINMKQFIITLAVFLILIAGELEAQQTYSLEKLLSTAIENNSEMKKAGMKQSESRFKTKEVIAKGLPQLNGAVNYSRMGIPNIQIPANTLASLPQDIPLGSLFRAMTTHRSFLLL